MPDVVDPHDADEGVGVQRDLPQPSTQPVTSPTPNPANKRTFHLPDWLSNWVATLTALISLAISLYTLVITTHEPQLQLIMPNQIRIAQGGDSGPLLYVQPMFISTGLSDRVEVVTDIRLQVEAIGREGAPVDFVWDERGEWVVDPNTMYFNWVFTGDSGPFLVSARDAQFFTALFIGPRDWLFGPGNYRISVTAERITVKQPLAASIEVQLSQEQVDFLNQSQGQQFLIFPVDK